MSARPIASSVILATVLVGAALALKFAQNHHLIAAETSTRTIQVILGLVLAVYGNAIPKSASVCGNGDVWSRRKQSLQRFGGWAFTLAGLGYAAIWALLPAAVAGDASMALVAIATAGTLGYTLKVIASRPPGNAAR